MTPIDVTAAPEAATTDQLRAVAEQVIDYALRHAREQGSWHRKHGFGSERATYQRASVYGQLLVAEFDLHADPIRVRAAKNEAAFLLGRYLDGAKQ